MADALEEAVSIIADNQIAARALAHCHEDQPGVRVPVAEALIGRAAVTSGGGSGSPLSGFPAMDLKSWQKALREAERELDAATTRTALDTAAKKFMRAKAELKWLEAKAST